MRPGQGRGPDHSKGVCSRGGISVQVPVPREVPPPTGRQAWDTVAGGAAGTVRGRNPAAGQLRDCSPMGAVAFRDSQPRRASPSAPPSSSTNCRGRPHYPRPDGCPHQALCGQQSCHPHPSLAEERAVRTQESQTVTRPGPEPGWVAQVGEAWSHPQNGPPCPTAKI